MAGDFVCIINFVSPTRDESIFVWGWMESRVEDWGSLIVILPGTSSRGLLI